MHRLRIVGRGHASVRRGRGHARHASSEPVTSCPLPYGRRRRSPCTFEGLCGFPETCCGITARGSGAGCSGGEVYYLIDDTCVFASCSPGCGLGEYTTSAGCTPCHEIDAFVRQRLEAAADAQGGCELDADCVAANTTSACGNYCDLAVHVRGVEAFEAAAADIGLADCSSLDRSSCRPSRADCDLSGDVRCVAGLCRELPACDPARYEEGDPCDDGSVCTTGDTCSARRCVGDAITCDDDNPCTTDTCDPVAGCTHTPNVLVCEPSNACSVGAQCADGVCATSPVSGADHRFLEPYRAAEAIAVRGDETYIAGWDGHGNWNSTGFVLTVGGAGTITRRLEPDLQFVSDVIVVPDGLLLSGSFDGTSLPSDQGSVAVMRVDEDGGEVWRRDFDTDRADSGARIAQTGSTVGVVWYSGSEPYEARVAITDLDGREPTLATLGEVDAGGAIAIAPAGTGFVVAFLRRPEGSNANVAVAWVTADGSVIDSVLLVQSDSDTVNGVLALPDGNAILWGHVGSRPWLRRVASGRGPGAAIVWEVPVWIGAAVLREGALDVLGSDGMFDHYSGQADAGTTWLARVDFDGREGPRVVMPRGYAIWDAAPIDDGFALVGNIASGIGHTPDSQIWLRRVATSPACPQ